MLVSSTSKDRVKPHASNLQAAHGLLETFGKGPTDSHRLTHRLHLSAQHWLGHAKLLKGESRHFGDDIVDGRLETRRCRSRNIVSQFVQGITDGEQSGDLRNRIPCRFTCERELRLTRGFISITTTRPVFGRTRRIEHCYHRCPPQSLESQPAKHLGAFELAVGECQGWCDRYGVPSMDAHRVNILNAANNDHIIRVVAHDFEFVFFPAQD